MYRTNVRPPISLLIMCLTALTPYLVIFCKLLRYTALFKKTTLLITFQSAGQVRIAKIRFETRRARTQLLKTGFRY